jgi:hypothetical protein
MTATIEAQIKDIELELKRTPYNKATQYHIGKLKAKLARLRAVLETRRTAKVGAPGKGYAIRKTGHATVAIVGYPSVGKSTLLNKITTAESAVADYEFTTINIIPGLMEYQGAKIQILDMPGLIRGASEGKGRGREVISAVRNADLILLLVDVFNPDITILVEELYGGGIRLNQQPPDIRISKRGMGGLDISTTLRLSKIDETMIKSILHEYRIMNATVVIREDITEDQLIDYIAGNRRYVPAIAVLNKIDMVMPEFIAELRNHPTYKTDSKLDFIPISAEKNIGLDKLKAAIYDRLNLIRVYLRPQGGEIDYREPLVIQAGTTINTVCKLVHREFATKFRYALVWGPSAKYPGQIVGSNHILHDGDIITIVKRRG